MRLRRAKKSDIEVRVNRAAEILGLTKLLDRYPKELSGGQRQRVAMGRAIVRDPKVFLFDEPLSNLDAKLRVAMRAEIKELHQRLRTTTVYVTHDQIEAMTMADKIVVMRDGIVEQIGAPLDLYDRPDNIFVARLHRLARHEPAGRHGSTAAPSSPPAACACRCPPNHSATSGRPLVYGLRPEHITLSDTGVPVEVVVVEPTGSETLIVVKGGQTELDCLFRSRILPKPGETLRILPDMAHAHLFDAESGSG